MKLIKLLLSLLSILFIHSCSGGEHMTLNELKSSIEESISNVQGTYAVAFVDMQTGEALYIREKENFHAASTMKTPVMIEVYKQAAEGKFNIDDSLEVINDFKSIVDGSNYSMDIDEDSGDSLYNYLGKKRTIYQLVYEMITVSSNLATNLLIDTVGAKNVTNTMRGLGADDIQVLRGVEDIKAYRQGMNNTTTAYDLAAIFDALAEKKLPSSDEMIKVLLDQKFNETIPSPLPDDVKMAHKTGWITGVRHDSGIVYLPDGKKYILVLLSKNVEDDDAGLELQRQISKMIYNYVISK